MLTYLRAFWAINPVRVTALGVALVVAVAARAGVVLPAAGVEEILALVVPILIGGEVARSQVSPAIGEIGTPNDELLNLDQAPAP